MIRFEKVSWEQYKKDVEKWANKKGFDINLAALKDAYDDIQLPRRATIGSAGYDFRMPFEIHCEPEEKVMIYTGIKVEMDVENDIVFLLFPKSGLSHNYGYELINTIGVVDEDYYNCSENEGHMMVEVKFDTEYTLKKGEKYAQGIFFDFRKTSDDNTTGVRTGGFGSTGKM